MPFDTFDSRTKLIAERSLAHCRHQFGSAGLVTEQGISPKIGWRPSFYCRSTKTLIVAVEVAENLYPEVLKGAAHDISFYEAPIAVYQACSLDAYQGDRQQMKVNALREHGFGIMTVDDAGLTMIQHPATPLAQHISSQQLESAIQPLLPKLKVAFREAYATYKTNIGQGLQQAGQVVESMVGAISAQSAKNGHISMTAARGNVASVIDSLYQEDRFKDQRAELGAARAFVNEFRNSASHPAKTPKQAAERMRKCKQGFQDAIAAAIKLQKLSIRHNYKMKITL